MPDSLLDLPVRDFLDAVAARTPTPGGGSVAAVTTALAASLTAMAARYSDLPADEVDELRARAAVLADADAAAFAAYRAALAADDEGRPAALERARDAAAAVPAEVAECAGRVAELAGELVRAGNPNLRSDAAAAVALAAASAAAAAELVAVNEPDSPRRRRAAEVAASSRVLAAVDGG
ncbi:cyclodeaminase/cyclohydrolase family protein [Pseudonocardia sp. CA-107938]|uniref:cyclodeaminase/cyclohydrolase family protein n=1 Tax=Pseudonocardia sp. CA-107938 TaxID=3240021 RepID=UPI003D8A0EA2